MRKYDHGSGNARYGSRQRAAFLRSNATGDKCVQRIPNTEELMKTKSLIEVIKPIARETQKVWEKLQITLDKIKYKQNDIRRVKR